MANKKPIAPDPVPEPLFTKLDLDTVEQISAAIEKMRHKIEFRLARNRREKSMLDLSKINMDQTLNMLRIANQASAER